MWITKIKRYAIYKRDKNTCGYCGRIYPLNRLTLDHIRPRALGGNNKSNNLVTACDDCNRRKSARTLGQYLVWLRINIKCVRVYAIKMRITKMRRRKLIYN